MKNVFDLRTNTWLPLEEAEAAGTFLKDSSTYVNQLTGELWSMEQAIKMNVVEIEQLNRQYLDKSAHGDYSSKFTIVKVKQRLAASTYVKRVSDASTGEWVGPHEAWERGLLQEELYYYHAERDELLRVREAAEAGFVELDFIANLCQGDLDQSELERVQRDGRTTAMEMEAIGCKLLVYGVHRVLDSRTPRGELVAFSEALNRGIIDTRTSAYRYTVPPARPAPGAAAAAAEGSSTEPQVLTYTLDEAITKGYVKGVVLD